MWDFGFSETQWYLDGQNIQKKTSWTHGNGMFLFIFEEIVVSASDFDIYEQVINPDVFIELLVH